ncbi:hypothetical protein J6590_079145 [Homalodisca vitripennis]|nr:hypothetical protein J6590_079145 [Homalodisca vitripennis]
MLPVKLEHVAVRVGEVCVSLCIAMQGCTTLIMLMFRFVNVPGGALEQVAVRVGEEQVAVTVGEVCVRPWITMQGCNSLIMLMFSIVNVAGGAQEQVAVRDGEIQIKGAILKRVTTAIVAGRGDSRKQNPQPHQCGTGGGDGSKVVALKLVETCIRCRQKSICSRSAVVCSLRGW